jgi:multidrug resistance efflux pump
MPLLHAKIRKDLIYTPDPEREGYWFVKDPIRGEYINFNEVQVEMMKALDGTRSPEAVHEFLGDELGVEIPLDKIRSFTQRLEREFLLDINTYTVDDERTRKAILKILEKRGLVFRAKPRNQHQPEAQMFTQGMEHLLRGNPSSAVGYFTAVLELNPKNERARLVVAAIQEGFLKTKVYTSSYKIHLPLWNPEQFLIRLDQLVGKFLFSKLGLLAIILLVASMAPPAIDILSRSTIMERPFGASDGIALFIALVFILLFHEAMHGLACTHYGGRVKDIGFQLFYFVIPGAYCDTSDVFLFKNRKHKAIVFIAGVGLELVPVALFWHLLYVFDPTTPGWNGLLVMVVFVTFNNYNNFVPLVQLDGYYAFASLVGKLNLRKESFSYLKRVLSRKFLGVHSEGAEPNQRERRLYLMFGIGACIYTPVFMLLIWVGWFLPWLVSQAGVVGFLFAAFWVFNVIGRKVVRALIKFSVFVFRERRTIFTLRRTFVFSAVTALIVGVMAMPFSYPIDGYMLLEPRQQVTVRVSEPGLLSSVQVREGDVVQAGQPLVILESREIERERAELAQRVAIAKLKLVWMESGASTQQLDLADARARSRQVESAAEGQRLRDADKQHKLEVRSTIEVASAQRAAAYASGMREITEAETDLVKAGNVKQEIDSARVTVRRWEAGLAEIDERIARLRILSPITGVVVGKRLDERVGERLEAGAELYTVVDTQEWRASIKPVDGASLSMLESGQTVVLRPYGSPNDGVEAHVEQILPPTKTGELPMIKTSKFGQPSWRSGMSGRARIYGPQKSLAYRLFAVPIIQIVDYDLWHFI